jgi:ribosomal protein S18 acetylase RimI-like enzyme
VIASASQHDQQPEESPRLTFDLVARRYDSVEAARLVQALYVEQRETYGFADPPNLETATDYDPPAGLFIVAYPRSGLAVGCGGVRTYDPDRRIAEIRKMYVSPAWRRRGVGQAILSHLERHAAAGHAQSVLLETGVQNTAAIKLYTSVGYKPIQPYVPGRKDANRAFAKTLVAAGQVS